MSLVRASVRHLVSLIEAARKDVDAGLKAVGHTEPLGHVLHHWTDTVGIDGYPVVMVQQRGFSVRPWSIPDTVRVDVTARVWTAVQWPDRAVQEDAVAVLAEAVARSVGDRHRSQAIGDGLELFYEGADSPVSDCSFGASQLDGAFVRTAVLDWRGSFLTATPDLGVVEATARRLTLSGAYGSVGLD